MSNRSFGIVCAPFAVMFSMTPLSSAHAQPPPVERAWEAPRTPWDDPDLQGVWNNNTVVPLQRPTDLADVSELTEEEIAERFHRTSSGLFPQDDPDSSPERRGVSYNEFWFEWGADTNRTSLIVDPPDGRLPDLTPDAQQRLASHPFPYGGRAGLDSWEGLSLFERCITRGMPGAMIPGFYNHNYQILQTPTHVVILYEMLHDARVIPLDDSPRPSHTVRQWLGVPRGRWEGETLVVETTRFNAKTNMRGPGGGGGGSAMIFTDFAGSEHARLIERFTRVSDDAIDYQFTLDDPTEFTAPFTVSLPMRRIQGALYEYACHEGNYALVNSLRSARRAEEARR